MIIRFAVFVAFAVALPIGAPAESHEAYRGRISNPCHAQQCGDFDTNHSEAVSRADRAAQALYDQVSTTWEACSYAVLQLGGVDDG